MNRGARPPVQKAKWPLLSSRPSLSLPPLSSGRDGLAVKVRDHDDDKARARGVRVGWGRPTETADVALTVGTKL